ncbi:hypothetical protein L228DRAFT_257689 [Xylona heveae TC161]|uniref:Uncharacterized protein n=1 Tax=Xylona heveae (strain CBS 132557 / TC161) TaxID=1328760 RepID=A0A165JGN6_XYLHT|nr:hypothetical protein L228DRAFT_257689 [Xylona heveae TC161]KZF26213.1 hypothetical protein L228DRAFT_257689 [Xylona heveae TC161]
MGWFWGSKDNNKQEDPFAQLDPSLRAFLRKESPIKYDTQSSGTTASTSDDAPLTGHQGGKYADIVFPSSSPKTETKADDQSAEDDQHKVPPESLFQDGRYAHIWKGYKSLSQHEEEQKSEQDKLMDVVDAFKQRRAQIGIAAVENCAEEQWALNDCWRNGSWKSRVDMCGTENRTFSRCYTTQARFLKALGYVSSWDRPAEVEEQIQMHADTLYHRMLDQQRQMDEAKAAGKPIPKFPPLMPGKGATASQDNNTAEVVSSMPDESHMNWVDRLTGYYTPALREKKRPPPPSPSSFQPTATTSPASTAPGSGNTETYASTTDPAAVAAGHVRDQSSLWSKLFPNSSFSTTGPPTEGPAPSSSASTSPSSPAPTTNPTTRTPIPFELPPDPNAPKSSMWSWPTFNPFQAAAASSISSTSPPVPRNAPADQQQQHQDPKDQPVRNSLGSIEDVDVREAISRLAPDVQAQLRRKIEKLPELEREIELRSIAAETVLGEKLVQDVADRVEEREKARAERRRTGTDTFGDKISWFFGW